MKAIYLTGFMGAGKTSVGKTLSKEIHVPVIDTDEVIVANEGRTIDTIFSEEGEEYFRNVETKVLQSLPLQDVIITTGGGIILRKENREFMTKHGTTFFLYCSPEHTYERLKNDASRPLLAGNKKQEIITRLHARLPLYREADYTIDTSHKSILEVANEIKKQLINNDSLML